MSTHICRLYNSITSRSLKDQSLVWIIIGCDGARIDDQLSNRYCCCCSTLNFLNSMTPKRYQFFPLAFASFNLSQLVPSKVWDKRFCIFFHILQSTLFLSFECKSQFMMLDCHLKMSIYMILK